MNKQSVADSHWAYIPALDGVRGMSVLIVLLFHAGREQWLPGGFVGVDVFFMLSGFLITRNALQEWCIHQRIDLKHFYSRRVARLMPALLVCLGGYACAGWLLDFQNAKHVWREIASVLFYFSNWSRAFDWGFPIWLGHAWSLAIEEQFYMLWPPLLCLLLTIFSLHTPVRSYVPLLLVCFISMVLIAVWRMYLVNAGASAARLYNGTDTRLDSMVWGGFLACVLMHQSLVDPLRRLLSVSGLEVILIGVLVYALCSLSWRDTSYYAWVLPMVQLVIFFLLFRIVMEPLSGLRRVCNLRVFRKLGKISYGLYLWHFPWFVFFHECGFSRMGVLFWGGCLSVMIALLSYRLIEQPVIAYVKHRVIKKGV